MYGHEYGHDGSDYIFDQRGNDDDEAFGGSGNDFIDVADGDPDDVVNCGTGERDKVVFDRGDEIAKSCERRDRQ